jgi:hypothetical protein
MKSRWWLIGLALAVFVAILSPLASVHPDGLERVAEDKGFIEEAHDPLFEVIPDYVLPGVSSEALATILAGIIGVVLMFGLTFGLGKLVVKRKA